MKAQVAVITRVSQMCLCPSFRHGQEPITVGQGVDSKHKHNTVLSGEEVVGS